MAEVPPKNLKHMSSGAGDVPELGGSISGVDAVSEASLAASNSMGFTSKTAAKLADPGAERSLAFGSAPPMVNRSSGSCESGNFCCMLSRYMRSSAETRGDKPIYDIVFQSQQATPHQNKRRAVRNW